MRDDKKRKPKRKSRHPKRTSFAISELLPLVTILQLEEFKMGGKNNGIYRARR
ncbi:hypothetical protein [Ureibacillus sp. FSL E2-3493]|uniref:hypothetical protein n=1 Tax=Ureibacillus sp. FSL E2-3493 TaxID=2921367 RepID=UPI003119CA1E